MTLAWHLLPNCFSVQWLVNCTNKGEKSVKKSPISPIFSEILFSISFNALPDDHRKIYHNLLFSLIDDAQLKLLIRRNLHHFPHQIAVTSINCLICSIESDVYSNVTLNINTAKWQTKAHKTNLFHNSLQEYCKVTRINDYRLRSD